MSGQLARALRALGDRTWCTFNELSPEAQERALDAYAEHFGDGYEWWDCTIEDALEQFKTLGVDTTEKDCAFSGLSSQGDGASFTGSYSYSRGAVKKIIAETNDREMHRIARELQEIQRRYFYALTASVTRSDHHYSHERTVHVEVDCERREVEQGDSEAVTECLRDLMRWMYKNLEAEYEYQSRGDGAREALIANEYHFNEDGSNYE